MLLMAIKHFMKRLLKRGERIYENFGFDNSYTTEGSESDDKYNVLPENDDPNQIEFGNTFIHSC